MSRKIHHLNRIVQFWKPINLIFPRFPIRNPLSDTDGIWNWQDSAESIEKIQLKKVWKFLIGYFYLFQLIWYICKLWGVLCLRWKTAECSSGLMVTVLLSDASNNTKLTISYRTRSKKMVFTRKYFFCMFKIYIAYLDI